MNMDNYHNIKRKYHIYFVLIGWSAIAISSYPSYIFAMWLADLLNIPMGEPVIEHGYGWFWVTGMLAVGITNFLLASAFLSFLIAKYKHWTYEQTMDYFVRYENLPKHWLKDETNT